MLRTYEAIKLVRDELVLEIEEFFGKDKELRSPLFMHTLADTLSALIQYNNRNNNA